jgi:phytoene synthase
VNSRELARQKLVTAPLDYRLALLFSPVDTRTANTALFATYFEIREVITECRDPGVAEVKLSWWQQEIEALFSGKPRHPVTEALLPFLSKITGQQQLFFDLITGARMDVTGNTLASFEDVKRYCYRHSGALAELSARLAGAHTPATLMAARLLGNSYRLAFIASAGAAQALHGRVYFATEDLKVHGVEQHINGDTHSDTGVLSLVEDYAGRSRAIGIDALAMLPANERCVLAPWHVLISLAFKRLMKLEHMCFSAGAEPVELQPLSALFTAWRGARRVH